MALNTKRMQTFFNEFLVTTVSFLNQFSSECEDKFFELERKLNKIESNLIIVEEKLASVPTEEKLVPQNLPEVETLKQSEPQRDVVDDIPPPTIPKESALPTQQEEPKASEPVNDNLIKISESSSYARYFKMLKYGINSQAVKLKMQSEDVDPSLLDNPDLLIEKTVEDVEE